MGAYQTNDGQLAGKVYRSQQPDASPRRSYSLKSGRLGGEIRFSAPHDTVPWYHGTSDAAATSIVKSQRLAGSGDYGDGGYLTSDWEWARDHTFNDERAHRNDPHDMYLFPGMVQANLRPKRPYYGGGEREDVENLLKSQGNDVWFPHGRTPSRPGDLAVLLDSNSSGAAKFTKEKLSSWDFPDFIGE
jgi:hypothetical protein